MFGKRTGGHAYGREDFLGALPGKMVEAEGHWAVWWWCLRKLQCGWVFFICLACPSFLLTEAAAAAHFHRGFRKLSGAFLACMKLRARVPCRDLFMNTFNNYNFDGEDPAASSDDVDVPHTATA